ncbi:MAG: hypothetical protein ACRDTF_04725 [Pseudonocardiaceae bacterium]
MPQWTCIQCALPACRDLGTLLPLGVLLHVQITRNWLAYAVAPTDLRRQAMFLARDLAREHNEPTSPRRPSSWLRH